MKFKNTTRYRTPPGTVHQHGGRKDWAGFMVYLCGLRHDPKRDRIVGIKGDKIYVTCKRCLKSRGVVNP